MTWVRRLGRLPLLGLAVGLICVAVFCFANCGNPLGPKLHEVSSLRMSSLDMVDSKTGWAVCSVADSPPYGSVHALMKTTDGGRQWSERRRFEASSEGGKVDFGDELHGWMYQGWPRTLQTTADGGQTWQRLPVWRRLEVFDFCLVDGSHGYVCGREKSSDGLGTPTVCITSDGGLTWTRTALPPATSPKLIVFLGATSGWVLGDGTLARTTDGGATWEAGDTSAWPSHQYALGFADALNGWVAGDYNDGENPSPFSMRTTDGGMTWADDHLPIDGVTSIVFADSQRGWAFGKGFAATDDGGNTWTKGWGGGALIWDASLASPDAAVASGYNGTFRTDGSGD